MYIEYLDILDENGSQTGENASSKEIHEKGWIHRAAHVWVLNSHQQLLLQLRAPNKAAYPNHWDISAAGHISSGESSLEGAKKETEEELGLSLPDEDFAWLFTIREYVVLNEGTYIANEFQDVYLIHCDNDIEEFIPQESEVSGLRWISIPELKDWLAGKGEPIVPHDKEYKQLLSYLESTPT